MKLKNNIRKDVPIALYYQVKEEMRLNILSNKWKEGSKLPSENELCEMFGVSRITVRKAIEALQAEDYIIKKQGKGTFVKSRKIGQKLHKFYSFSEELSKLGIKETIKLLVFETIIPDTEVRDALKLEPDEKVYWIKRIRYMDAKAYTIENSYIPAKMFPGLTGEMVQNNGLYKSMRMYNCFMDRAIETFSAINITKEDAKYIDVQNNDAAIKLTRVTYSGTSIVEYCQSVVRGDVFQYSVELK